MTTLIILFISANARTQDDFQFDGYVATTVTSVYKALHPDVFYHAKVEVQYKVTKATEAQVQIKAQSNEGERIRFREANIRIKTGKDSKVKIGNMKKPIGEEEMYSEEDLPTIDRTFLYNYLNPMNHVGRDIGVQFINEPDGEGLYYNLGVYLNNSSTFAAAGRVATGELIPNVTVALAGVYQNLRLDENVAITTLLGNLSFSYDDKHLYWNIEGFAGVDPFASRFRQLATGSTTEKVWLLGGKVMGSYFFEFGEKKGLEPVVVVGYLAPDTRNTEVFTLEFLIGANYYFNKHTRVRLNVHPLLSKNGISDEFSRAGSSVSLEMQLRW